MKTRKLLPLILLAVGALFALTSCDALLDAIFATNQITVDVRVLATPDVYSDYYWDTATVQVRLYDNGGLNSTGTLHSSTGYYGGYVHFYLTFTGLSDDTYSISTVYNGAYAGYISNSPIYDTLYDTHGSIGYNLGNAISMPYDDSLQDVTGHSVELRVYL